MPISTPMTSAGATAAAGTGVTVTIAAPAANKFHNIAYIEIIAYSSVARVGGATPVTVTTTNLGGLQWTFSSAASIGTQERVQVQSQIPLLSTTAATATTIVCPATTSVIWTVNVVYAVG